MARRVYQGTTVKIGQRQIAKQLGCDVKTVNRAIHELEKHTYITIIGNGKARRTYHLHSSVFGKKQRAGIEEVISSPSGTPRLASVRTERLSAFTPMRLTGEKE
jgi:DNA-binding MarR family transcriptional regulator